MGGFDKVYPEGMKRKGNLNPNKFIAEVKNPDGSVSTIRTVGVNLGNGEIIIPTVHPDGYIMSTDEAIERYKKTGENFGTFETPQQASAYSKMLHEEHARQLKNKAKKK